MFHVYRQAEVHIDIIGALYVNEQPILFIQNKVAVFYSAAIVSPASEKWATIIGYRKQLKNLISNVFRSNGKVKMGYRWVSKIVY
jgi:hypothetical protein